MFNKKQSFVVIFFVCLFLLISLATPVTAYAADLPPWFGSSSNIVIDLVDDAQYLNAQTGARIFAYFDYLYENNMTDGMQLFAFDLKKFGGNATGGAANKTTLVLYFSKPDTSAYYAYRSSSNLVIVSSVTGGPVDGYYLSYPLLFGNFKIYSMSSSGQIANFGVSGYFWGYRDGASNVTPGVMQFGGSYVSSNLDAGNTEILPWVIQSREVIESWISSGSSEGGVSSGDPVVLDFGSIISAVMTAPMIVFGGLTGSPGNLENSLILFGIDIRLTLISLLVIAIVVFIIKFLRGG